MSRIPDDAVNGADADAGLVIIKTDALGAEIRIDFVHLVTHGDGLIRTLRLTHVAVDALTGDEQHPRGTSQFRIAGENAGFSSGTARA